MIYVYPQNELADLLAAAVNAARTEATPLRELVYGIMVKEANNPERGMYAVVERPKQGLTYMVLSADHHNWATDPTVNINTENADDLIRNAAGALLSQMRLHYAALPSRH